MYRVLMTQLNLSIEPTSPQPSPISTLSTITTMNSSPPHRLEASTLREKLGKTMANILQAGNKMSSPPLAAPLVQRPATLLALSDPELELRAPQNIPESINPGTDGILSPIVQGSSQCASPSQDDNPVPEDEPASDLLGSVSCKSLSAHLPVSPGATHIDIIDMTKSSSPETTAGSPKYFLSELAKLKSNCTESKGKSRPARDESPVRLKKGLKNDPPATLDDPLAILDDLPVAPNDTTSALAPGGIYEVSKYGPTNPVFLPPITLFWRESGVDVHTNFHLAYQVPGTDSPQSAYRKQLARRIFATSANIIKALKLDRVLPSLVHFELFTSFVEFTLEILDDCRESSLTASGISPPETLTTTLLNLACAASDENMERYLVSLVLDCALQPLDGMQRVSANILLSFLKIWASKHTVKTSTLLADDQILFVFDVAIEMVDHLLVWKTASELSLKRIPGNPFDDESSYCDAANPAHNTAIGMVARSSQYLRYYSQPSKLMDSRRIREIFRGLTEDFLGIVMKHFSSILLDGGVTNSPTDDCLFLPDSGPRDNLWQEFLKNNPSFEAAPDEKLLASQLEFCAKYETLLMATSIIYLGESPERLATLVAKDGTVLANNIFFREGRVYMAWGTENPVIRRLGFLMSAFWLVYLIFVVPFKEKLSLYANENQAPRVTLDPQTVFRDISNRPFTAAGISNLVSKAIGLDIPLCNVVHYSRRWRISTGIWVDGSDGWCRGLTLEDASKLKLPLDDAGDRWLWLLMGEKIRP
ncbi:hypothetical protein TWF730_003777 [Orbilia blumenaviensis]|uniref:Uncharacterized protein n=1 Tax=Orbilia blumenaviensis TaxID=1796055 RepID=A0AAV9U5R9_9PEZI